MRSPTANMVAKYIVSSNIVTLPITGNVSVQGCVLFLYDEVKSAYTLILISIDTEPCRKNPIKTLTCPKCQSLRENYTEKTCWLKFP